MPSTPGLRQSTGLPGAVNLRGGEGKTRVQGRGRVAAEPQVTALPLRPGRQVAGWGYRKRGWFPSCGSWNAVLAGFWVVSRVLAGRWIRGLGKPAGHRGGLDAAWWGGEVLGTARGAGSPLAVRKGRYQADYVWFLDCCVQGRGRVAAEPQVTALPLRPGWQVAGWQAVGGTARGAGSPLAVQKVHYQPDYVWFLDGCVRVRGRSGVNTLVVLPAVPWSRDLATRIRAGARIGVVSEVVWAGW